jgi:hypothetical protein
MKKQVFPPVYLLEATFEAYKELSNVRFPVTISWALSEYLDNITPEVNLFKKKRDEIIIRFGKKLENGSYYLDPRDIESINLAMPEFEELNSIKSKHPVFIVELKTLPATAEISANTLKSLKTLFEYKEEPTPELAPTLELVPAPELIKKEENNESSSTTTEEREDS